MESAVEANWLAYVALLTWPLISIGLFCSISARTATIWTILGAFLLLPAQVSIKIPMVPAIDKDSIASLSALAGCLIFAGTSRRAGGRVGGVVALLGALYVVGPVITSLLNNDLVVAGNRVLPGVGAYDGISALLRQSILLAPFFLGRRLFATPDDGEHVLRALALAGLLFSVPLLFEIRMSPQLSSWVYGYSPPFATEFRYGGFRPVVFMNNGLVAAFFLSTSLLAAVAIWRIGKRFSGFSMGPIVGYLGAVLILCKSAGALVYAIVFGSVVRWFTPRLQVRLAVVIATIAISYPLLRAVDLFPDKQLVEIATTVSQERADSLKFRFDQENQLLAHALKRAVFGWGRYGRSRVYEESGKDSSVTDGLWVIIFGQFGLVGFIALFGLLALPVFRVVRAIKGVGADRERQVLAALALIVAITAIEQLPNASISSWSWLLAGSLLGLSERIRPVRKTRSSMIVGKDATAAGAGISQP